jgi:hypothetical protein
LELPFSKAADFPQRFLSDACSASGQDKGISEITEETTSNIKLLSKYSTLKRF